MQQMNTYGFVIPNSNPQYNHKSNFTQWMKQQTFKITPLFIPNLFLLKLRHSLINNWTDMLNLNVSFKNRRYIYSLFAHCTIYYRLFLIRYSGMNESCWCDWDLEYLKMSTVSELANFLMWWNEAHLSYLLLYYWYWLDSEDLRHYTQ